MVEETKSIYADSVFEADIIPERGVKVKQDVWSLLARIIVLLVTMPIHEFAHGYTATKLGDPTPGQDGRLTLNPIKHLSLFGSMALLLLGFGWAKPVQVDTRYFKHPRRDMALTALAGPLANVMVAFLAFVIYKVVYYTLGIRMDIDAFMTVLIMIILINIQLAVFNLLPIPPLDGAKILGFFLPDRFYMFMLRYERYVMLVLMALLWMNILDRPIVFLADKMISLLELMTRPVDLFFRYVVYR